MLRRIQLVLLLVMAILLKSPRLAAQEQATAPAEQRTWTSREGQHTTEATFAGFRAGKVRLQKADGTTVQVPLFALSDDDQDYVRDVAQDDPDAVQILEQRKVEFEQDEAGRVVEARFPAKVLVSGREIELLGGLPNLQRLSLAQVRFAEGTFDSIKQLVNLRQLDLTATPVGNAEVQRVVELKRLTALSLSDTRITNRALSLFKALPELSELLLANTRIGDEGIASLEELKHLKKLNLGNTRVSPQGVLRLRKALPNTAMEGSGVVRR